MRAELVAIYTTLDKFATHEWVGIFRDSLSSNMPSGTDTQTRKLEALNIITTTCSF